MLRVWSIRCHVCSGTSSTLLCPFRCYVRYAYRCRLFPYYLGGGQLECASVRISMYSLECLHDRKLSEVSINVFIQNCVTL